MGEDLKGMNKSFHVLSADVVNLEPSPVFTCRATLTLQRDQ